MVDITIPKYFRFRYNKEIYNIKREYVISFVSFMCFLVILLTSSSKKTSYNDASSMNFVMTSNHKVKEKKILVLFTTFSDPDNEYMDIVDVQKNTLTYMSMMPNVIPVLFTNSEYWLEQCIHYHVNCISDFQTNNYNLPYLFGLFASAISHFPGVPFYGYINGDILIERTISDVLFQIYNKIQLGELSPKVALYTQRNNFYFSPYVDLYSALKDKNKKSMDELFENQLSRSRPYWDAAIDLFVFTPSTFIWETMPHFVIGRAKFDNWIIQYTTTNNKDIETVDMTNYVKLLHQTGKKGNRSGVKKERAGANDLLDLRWNDNVLQMQNILSCDQMWFMQLSKYTIVSDKNSFCLQLKGESTYYEDDFMYPEMKLMKKYIQPNDNCLILSMGSLIGTIFQLCKTVTIITVNNNEYIDTKDRLAQCFPSSSYKIYCTNIRPELYPQEFVAPLLTIPGIKYDDVIVLIKEAPSILKYLQPVLRRSSRIFLRRYKLPSVNQGMVKGTGLSIVEQIPPLIHMEGPHFPDLGFAVLKLL